MIKKILLAIAMALPVCFAAQAQKFGIVDPESIIPGRAEYDAAQKEIAAASKTFESEYAKIQEEFKTKYEEFQKLANDTATPQAIKDRRMQEIQELNQKAEQFGQSAQQELARKQQQLMASIQEKLVTAITAVGKEGNFTMIFPAGVPAYQAADVVDVTPLVKAKLGVKDTPAASTAAPAAK